MQAVLFDHRSIGEQMITQEEQSLETEIRSLKVRITMLTSGIPTPELDEAVKQKLELEHELSEIRNQRQREQDNNGRS